MVSRKITPEEIYESPEVKECILDLIHTAQQSIKNHEYIWSLDKIEDWDHFRGLTIEWSRQILSSPSSLYDAENITSLNYLHGVIIYFLQKHKAEEQLNETND